MMSKFAEAVQETTKIFEQRLKDLSKKFNDDNESEIGSDWNLDEDSEELQRFGCVSSLSGYLPRRDFSTDSMSKVITGGQRPKSSVLDHKEASPLKRTSSVKVTARERSTYENPYLRSINLQSNRRKRMDQFDLEMGRSPNVSVFTPAEDIVALDTSKEREEIMGLSTDILATRKKTRSLRVQEQLSDINRGNWRRKTIHTSQPYSPVENYHRQRSLARERKSGQMVRYPSAYRKSVEDLDKAVEEDTQRRITRDDPRPGSLVLSRFYRESRFLKSRRGERYAMK